MHTTAVSAIASFGEVLKLGFLRRLFAGGSRDSRYYALVPVVSLSDPTSALDRSAAPRIDALDFDTPNRPEMVAEIRTRVVDFARTMPFTQENIEDIRLAVGEAASNALRHGAGDGSCRIAVHLERRPDALAITIRDMGCGFDPDSVPMHGPDWLGEGGRGIWFMRSVMDQVIFRANHPGTTVEMVKRLPNQEVKAA